MHVSNREKEKPINGARLKLRASGKRYPCQKEFFEKQAINMKVKIKTKEFNNDLVFKYLEQFKAKMRLLWLIMKNAEFAAVIPAQGTTTS